MKICSASNCVSVSMARGLCQKHYMQFRRANPGAPRLYEYGVSLKDKVEKFYDRTESDGCWLWKGAKNEQGYGRISGDNGVMLLAHRAVWTVEKGKIPAGMILMHVCDTPACVNPKHLRVATQAENLLDMRAKMRGSDPPWNGGAKHHSARLTEADVRAIRSSKESSTAIADRLGVHRTAVIKARSGKTWKHID